MRRYLFRILNIAVLALLMTWGGVSFASAQTDAGYYYDAYGTWVWELIPGDPAVEGHWIIYPIYEEPVVEEPVVEEPVTEEPVAEEPVVEEPVTEEPVVEEPVVDDPVVDDPVAEVPADEVAVAEIPFAGVSDSEDIELKTQTDYESFEINTSVKESYAEPYSEALVTVYEDKAPAASNAASDDLQTIEADESEAAAAVRVAEESNESGNQLSGNSSIVSAYGAMAADPASAIEAESVEELPAASDADSAAPAAPPKSEDAVSGKSSDDAEPRLLLLADIALMSSIVIGLGILWKLGLLKF